jgi:hypothetical protein
VCLGTFADTVGSRPGCDALFTELMDVVDQRRAGAARDQEPVKWRP